MTYRWSDRINLAGRWTAAALLAASLTAGCNRGESVGDTSAAPAPAPAKPEYGDFGLDLTARKDTVKPGDDFFAYANGSWQETFTIPPDKAAYSMGHKLDDEARANVRKIIEGAAASKPAPGSIERKIGDYFASFMDTTKIEADGVNAIKPDLDRIAAVKTAS
jgi:putative endopeptidase